MEKIDIICVGEVLIDFIGMQTDENLVHTTSFRRFLGGSPTNVAVNAAMIGMKSALVATCGQDSLGLYIVDELHKHGVKPWCLRSTPHKPTSTILVSRTTETPDFIAYREADGDILEEQLPDEMLKEATIFHTSCFALSRNPARDTILNRAARAKELGLTLSVDINYSEKIWPETQEAIQVIQQFLSFDPLVKISEDDCLRLFKSHKTEEFIFDYFHGQGASTICLTKGKNGVVVSDLHHGLIRQPAQEVKTVIDATGAGDAFWTGFLYSTLKKWDLERCVLTAQKLASIKIQHMGRLPEKIDLESL
ncbi:carbohydrate kinase family protein [Nonlabens xiamenensis]|uniref:carbohydrate kinase family protein n=1 Tax=Nonlabens xiamenensis TaxID=2341043 RepID=UPI000F613342|nr:PfkB family carbohydrate kinase [Nonlabens xiamenensis]